MCEMIAFMGRSRPFFFFLKPVWIVWNGKIVDVVAWPIICSAADGGIIWGR